MPKVVIQLLSDTEELHAESTVIADASIEEAEHVMAAAVDAAMESQQPLAAGLSNGTNQPLHNGYQAEKEQGQLF